MAVLLEATGRPPHLAPFASTRFRCVMNRFFHS